MRNVMDLVKKQSRDSKEWASCFCEYMERINGVKLDEDYVHTWFANAMMSMYDSIHNNEIKELKTKTTQALGWMHAEACLLQDAGLDIRTKNIPELLERAERDLDLDL